jgi:hypothetical protein
MVPLVGQTEGQHGLYPYYHQEQTYIAKLQGLGPKHHNSPLYHPSLAHRC